MLLEIAALVSSHITGSGEMGLSFDADKVLS